MDIHRQFCVHILYTHTHKYVCIDIRILSIYKEMADRYFEVSAYLPLRSDNSAK